MHTEDNQLNQTPDSVVTFKVPANYSMYLCDVVTAFWVTLEGIDSGS